MGRRDTYDIAKIRQQVKKRAGRGSDPTEFKPPKMDDNQTMSWLFYVLPGFKEGDQLVSGQAERSMDQFFLMNGAHYLEGKRIGCPRIVLEENCDICQAGFDMLQEIDKSNKDKRREVASKLLPGTYYKVNIFFPNIDKNPEDLRGQVRWFNAPKTVFERWEECLYRDDDGGDPEEPMPYGVFFCPEEAYLFQLTVTKQGQNNSYLTSKFRLTESVQLRPIAGKVGAPDEKAIAEILSRRIDLYSKLPDIDQAEIARVARNITGDDTGGGFDRDETSKQGQDGAKQETSKQGQDEAKQETPKQEKSKGGIRPNVTKSSDKSVPVDDDDPVSNTSSVENEMPVDMDDTAKVAEPEGSAPSADEDIDALMAQLGD